MIKIKIGSKAVEFETNADAMRYIAEQAGDRALQFQRLAYDGITLVSMDYLTYKQGRLSETYETKN